MTLDANDFDFVQQFARAQSGLVLDASKAYLVEARLTRVAYRAGFTALKDFIAHLRRDAPQALRMQAIDALLTNETRFFRDDSLFEALKTSIIPALIKKRSQQRQLNLWCAAASSGQEPYSVAILLAEHFPALLSWTVQSIASDISASLLERSQQGCYSQFEVNRGVPAPLLKKYFHQYGTQWQVTEHIRRQIMFCHLNLIHMWPPLPPMDIIFMRNVLIYFGAETKETILAKARQLLKPDGYLILGSSETSLKVDTTFKRVQFDKIVCYQPEA